jgi:translation initiation factor 1
MTKQKSSRPKPGNPSSDRLVYSEFSSQRPSASNPATQPGIADLPPSKQALRLEVSRKGRGGKTVTLISGFQHSPDTLKALLKKLKAQCGTGGTAKDDTLEIQGDHASTLLEVLQQMGYTVKRSGG